VLKDERFLPITGQEILGEKNCSATTRQQVGQVGGRKPSRAQSTAVSGSKQIEIKEGEGVPSNSTAGGHLTFEAEIVSRCTSDIDKKSLVKRLHTLGRVRASWEQCSL